MAKKKSKQVVVKIKTDGGEVQKDLHLYLFDTNEKFLESAEFKNGEAKLKTDSKSIRGRSQIIIGPGIPEAFKSRRINPLLIRKMGGHQPSFKLDRNNEIAIVGLPKFKFPTWGWCLITGNLSKSFSIGGEDKVLPVCDARVHICEIDRIKWWWPKIPRLVITDLGKRLKDYILRPEIELPTVLDPKLPIKRIINPDIDIDFNTREGLNKSVVVKLPDDVKRGILSNSETVVHKTIFDNFHLLHPYLCLWPKFWPYFYHCQHIATVKADCNGNFDYNYLNFTNDRDIYIWVEVNIDGEWVTVYRPRIACHTYWNYKCGTNINIRITDPRVPPCDCRPLPGAYVWMKRINTGKSIRSIEQNHVASGHLSDSIGLTWYSSTRVSPFGGSFPFVVKFGDGFPAAGGVTHYRWSYRRLKDAFLTDVTDPDDHYLTGAVSKPYEYDIVTSEGTLGAKGAYELGPFYHNDNLKYRIPHEEASVDVPTEPTAEYNHRDTSTIPVPSTDLENGLYIFKFELLNDQGEVVPVHANTFLVDKLASETPAAPDADTVFADSLNGPGKENYLVKDSSGKAIAFTFKVRIDNQNCYADVLDALVNGSSTDTECGIGHYDDPSNEVILKFLAGHPQDFATYNFRVTKGNSNNVLKANEGGYVTQTNNGYAISPYTLDPDKDIYEKSNAGNSLTVVDMVGTCTMAAFAEVLRVYATHTNGHRRLHEYDRSDVAAIAMATP